MMNIKNYSKLEFPSLHVRYRHWVQKNKHREVSSILSHPEPPQHYDSEEIFEQLQNAYLPLPEYGYDSFSTWQRGTQRALQLLRISNLHTPGFSVLDAGCGDGIAGYMLSCYGHLVTLTDLEDWRDERAKNIPFVSGNLCSKLPLESNHFDLIYSYNTFEHVEDPAAALAELVRVCKEDGLIYLDFAPLYASPWGLHAYRTMRMPYPQFLFSPSFIDAKLQKLNIYDLGKQRTTLQPMNRWRLSQFEQLWQACNCDIVDVSIYKEFSHLDVIRQFPRAFTGLELKLEDMTTSGMNVTLRKRSKNAIE